MLRITVGDLVFATIVDRVDNLPEVGRRVV
jgi:hypothetical protein